jgi:hypothetical protein
MIWYHLGGGMEVAIFFFLALWAILSIILFKFQNPRLREELLKDQAVPRSASESLKRHAWLRKKTPQG